MAGMKCEKCGSAFVVTGTMTTGMAAGGQFRPDERKFLALPPLWGLAVKGIACTMCGHLELYVDPDDLKYVTKQVGESKEGTE